MTGSTFGLSKRRLLLRDIEQIPVPALESACCSTAGKRLVKLARECGEDPLSDVRWREIDEAVFDLYELGVTDRIAVRDGMTRAGWQWKSGKLASADPADTDPDLMAYSRAFLSVVNPWLVVGKRYRMECQIFDLPKEAPHRAVRFFMKKGTVGPEPRVTITKAKFPDMLEKIGERLQVQVGKFLVGQHTLRVHGPENTVIIKPAAKRHWMGISALNDADAVLVESLKGRD